MVGVVRVLAPYFQPSPTFPARQETTRFEEAISLTTNIKKNIVRVLQRNLVVN